MLLDGFTVVAQIINFLILVYLLRRLLYGPIMRVMREREARAAAQLEEAAALKQDARREAESYRQQQDDLAQQREALLSAAKEEAESQRKALTQQARQEIEGARANWYAGIEAERRAFMQEFRHGVIKQACRVSRRLLHDLADADLEQEVIAVFVRRLEGITPDERQALVDAAHKAEHSLVIRSAFTLDAEQQQQILDAVQGITGFEMNARFEILADLVCGVEIIIHDYKLAWSLDHYLTGLEDHLIDAVNGEVVADEARREPDINPRTR